MSDITIEARNRFQTIVNHLVLYKRMKVTGTRIITCCILDVNVLLNITIK